MDEHPLARLIEAMHGTIQGHAIQLDALDEAIGDGDHGTNLVKAFAALSSQRDRLAAMPLADGLVAGRRHCRARGRRRRRQVLRRAVPRHGHGGRRQGRLVQPISRPCSTPGVAAVRAEGGAAKGDKTLLDVLLPVAQGVRSQIAGGQPEGIGARIVAAAAHGLHATTHMQAKHGLAADLGVASVNRIDPGACSCALLFGAAVGALEAKPQAA